MAEAEAQVCEFCAYDFAIQGDFLYEITGWHGSNRDPSYREKACFRCDIILYNIQKTSECPRCLVEIATLVREGELVKNFKTIKIAEDIAETHASIDEILQQHNNTPV